MDINKQINPNIERIYKKFVTELELDDNVPKEVIDRLKNLLSSNKKIDTSSIDKIING